ncbi:hypothetical protein BD408DRAFT_428668 [Parasitella parasitica]|nr:hypothetical protein BD408DRAFT_428668 [Parasitella parasitica]
MKFKKRQLECYVAGPTIINPPASFLKPSSGLRSKVQTSKERTDYWNAPQLQFRICLLRSILHSKKKNGEYDELYISLLKSTRIPKGVVQEAEAKIKRPGKITTMLSTVYTQNKKAGSPKKNYDNDDKDSEDSEDEDKNGATQDDAEQFRACSISLSQMLRDDLKDDIRSLFINKIGATMEQVSNYTSDFSKQVLKVALLFADIASILPEGYLEEDLIVPKPLNSSSLENDEFNAHYQSLFLESHLEQMHSTYYGQVGIEESILKKPPLHKAIVNVLGRDEANSQQNLSSHVVKMARQQCYTNLRIIWSENTIVNKLLRKLLNFLLLIHLSPDQDHATKAKKTERESAKLRKNHKGKQRVTNCSILMAEISVLNKTRNGSRKLFSDEKKLKAKYEEKGKHEATDMCQMRIDSDEQVLYREQQKQGRRQESDTDDREDYEKGNNTNVSRKRISQLVNIARSALFATQDITNAYLQDQDVHITTQESATIIKITSFIRPYIPSSETYHLLSCQLKFILMANQVLRSIGYEGQVAKLIPIV